MDCLISLPQAISMKLWARQPGNRMDGIGYKSLNFCSLLEGCLQPFQMRGSEGSPTWGISGFATSQIMP